jgi:hypothetical protein
VCWPFKFDFAVVGITRHGQDGGECGPVVMGALGKGGALRVSIGIEVYAWDRRDLERRAVKASEC